LFEFYYEKVPIGGTVGLTLADEKVSIGGTVGLTLAGIAYLFHFVHRW